MQMNERTRMTLAIVIAGLVLFGWKPMLQGIEHVTGWELVPKPVPIVQGDPSTQPVPAAPATAPAAIPGAISATPTQPVLTPAATAQLAPAPAGAGTLGVLANATTPPPLVTIGSAKPSDTQFAMQIALSSRGGGIVSVTLNEFKRSVGSDEPFVFENPDNTGGISALSTRSITVKYGDAAPDLIDLANAQWRVETVTERSATLAIDIGADSKPVVTVYKTFDIPPRDEGGAAGPQGFDTNVKYTFANRTDRPVVISSVINGPTFPPSEQSRGGDRQVIAGYREPNTIKLNYQALESFSAKAPSKDFTLYENFPLVWIGAGGNYFNSIVRPIVAPGQPTWVRKATADTLNPQEETAHLRQVGIAIETTDLALAPGAQQELEAKVFFGPRWRTLLKNAYYVDPNIGYHHTLEISGSCTYCTFQFLIDWLMWLLAFFHMILRDWGLAIIALVFLVRALLHPITKKAQVNMAKMQKFGPELERLKKKYANDKDALNRAMMQFYKQQGATPVLGCLPMFLQMPIWIALYSGLSSTFELRLQPFFYGLTWIKDLAKPDHLITFSEPVHFLFFTFDGVNIIPFLMAGAFWLQAKLQPKPPAMTPEQEQQQKMMQWMTLLFPVMLYSSPSGLNVYILTSTVFGIIENKIIRKHIKEQDARAATGPVIVDAEILDAKDVPKKGEAPKKPGGGLMGWFTNLQQRADNLRQDAERKAQQQQRNKKK